MPSKIRAEITGHVRSIKDNAKCIKFGIPVYAGKKDDEVYTKWFNCIVFDKHLMDGIQVGDYIKVTNAYVSINKYQDKEYESWVIPGKDASIEKLPQPIRLEGQSYPLTNTVPDNTEDEEVPF